MIYVRLETINNSDIIIYAQSTRTRIGAAGSSTSSTCITRTLKGKQTKGNNEQLRGHNVLRTRHKDSRISAAASSCTAVVARVYRTNAGNKPDIANNEEAGIRRCVGRWVGG